MADPVVWSILFNPMQEHDLICSQIYSFDRNCSMIHILHASHCEQCSDNYNGILRPRQNGRHFADDLFKSIFLNGNVWISNKFSLNVVPTVTVNNIPSLFKIMAWRLVGAKPLSETMLVRLPTDICVTRPEWVNLLLVVLNGWVMSAGDCPITVTSWWARWRPKSLASPLFAQLLV